MEGFYKVRRVDEGFYVTCVAEESRLDVVTIGLREKDSPPMGFRAGCAFFFAHLEEKYGEGGVLFFLRGRELAERGRKGGREGDRWDLLCLL